MGYLLSVVFGCILGLSLASQADHDHICNKDYECIVLYNCTEIYRRWQQNSHGTLPLIKSISCGLENIVPKVCCKNEPPPSTTKGQAARGFSTDLRFSAPAAKNLLPNNSICGIQDNYKIVGGKNTSIDEHPWMALLIYENESDKGFFCGGALISSRYILTAAHCVNGTTLPPSWKLTQVRLGEWNTSSERDCSGGFCSDVLDVPIEEALTHELYNRDDVNKPNDIAILRLSQDVEYNDFMKPICLPSTPNLLNNTFEGYTVEVAGWGKTEKSYSSDVKLKVRLPVYKHKECQEQYGREDRQVTTSQLCAGGRDGQDTCTGDSGGALMGQDPVSTNWMAVGVVSYGPSPCGTQGWPGIYTRVTSYVEWIKSHMRP